MLIVFFPNLTSINLIYWIIKALANADQRHNKSMITKTKILDFNSVHPEVSRIKVSQSTVN